MKYFAIIEVLLIAIAFAFLGAGVGNFLGCIIQFVFDLRADIFQYIFAIPFAILFAIVGGSLVIISNETVDCLSQRFAQIVTGILNSWKYK